MLAKIRVIKREGKEKFSEVCQKWVLSNFDKKKNYKRYLELYQGN